MATTAKISKGRQAQIFVGKRDRNIHVLHPGKLTLDDMHRVDKKLVEVVKGLTGCSCLSGTIGVIWENQYDKVLNVELGEAFRG